MNQVCSVRMSDAAATAAGRERSPFPTHQARLIVSAIASPVLRWLQRPRGRLTPVNVASGKVAARFWEGSGKVPARISVKTASNRLNTRRLRTLNPALGGLHHG